MIVTTTQSTYEVDLGAKTVTRITHGDELRRDDEPLKLHFMEEPIVGKPWRMAIEVVPPNEEFVTVTIRTTTEVISIQD